jgi:hypothetical protein
MFRIIRLNFAMEHAVKVTVQILQCDYRQSERVLHSFAHSAASLRVVKESMRAVFFSNAWPDAADAFRVLSNDGTELCRWPGRDGDIFSLESRLAA